MLVKVEQKHIDKGRCFSPEACPIALAIKDLGFEGVSVGVEFTYIENEVYNTKKEMREFMKKFDRGEAVEPFEFEITQ